MPKPLAKKADPNVRCCGICGKPGGIGSTLILKMVLGYDIPPGTIAYAHRACVVIEKRKQK